MDKQTEKKKLKTTTEVSVGLFVISLILFFSGGYAVDGDWPVIIGIALFFGAIGIYVIPQIAYMIRLKQNIEALEYDIEKERQAGKNTDEAENSLETEKKELSAQKKKLIIVSIVFAIVLICYILSMAVGFAVIVWLLNVFTSVD